MNTSMTWNTAHEDELTANPVEFELDQMGSVKCFPSSQKKKSLHKFWELKFCAD